MCENKPSVASILPANLPLETLYAELRVFASGFLFKEKAGHTLQSTALVHESLVRLARDAARDVRHPSRAGWKEPGEFFRLASVAMQRVLIEHARRRSAVRRGGRPSQDTEATQEAATGKRIRYSLEHVATPTAPRTLRWEQIERLQNALDSLEQADSRAAAVVRFRFFSGLTNEEIAKAISVSVSTVESDWRFARAWVGRAVGNTVE